MKREYFHKVFLKQWIQAGFLSRRHLYFFYVILHLSNILYSTSSINAVGTGKQEAAYFLTIF